MSVSPEIRSQVVAAVRDCRIKVVGHDLVKNDSEARLLLTTIKAYGNSAAGFIYASPSRARSTLRPPDVVLCHPDVGLLVIEAKGFGIEDVEGVEAGTIFVRRQGYPRPENAVRQVEDQMFEIDTDIAKLVRDRRAKPLTNCMVAFPRIREAEWAARGYDRAHPSSQLLFMDQIDDLSRFKKRIANLVREGLAQSRKEQPLTATQVEVIGRVFGNSDVINEKRPPRAWVEKEKLGSYIDEMAALEKYLSEEQKELCRLEFEGTQRLVRGVAGSGKSVVLANLVARYLHRQLDSLDEGQLPELGVSIAVTCFNHALVDFLKQKIRTAYREQTLNEEIPGSVMLVTHLNNLIWTLIKHRGWPLNYIRVGDVPNATTRASMYREQVRQFARESPEYYQSCCLDAVFLDEGQDFESEEYGLLLDIIRPHPETGERPIVVFYDDAQNLYARSRPVWKDIGINVAAGDRSRVMRECYRNTRPIVELAFNVLLGSQAPPDMRVQTRTYADVAYLKERGLVEEVGDHFRVRFAEREYQPPNVVSLPSEAAEIDWLSSELVRLIRDENVRPEDILVVFSSSRFGHGVLEMKIKQQLPNLKYLRPFGASSDKDQYIFQPGHLTLSTPHGAKGYDAPIVFVAGADRFDTTREGRAAFYVGASSIQMTPLIIVIDGNNLAYPLYRLPAGSHLTPEIDALLIEHMSGYAQQHDPERIQVELCLDGGLGSGEQHAGLRVYRAGYPSIADDEVLGRVEYHLRKSNSCVVVTLDGEVADEARSRGASVWPVSDFILQAGKDAPRFHPPPEALPPLEWAASNLAGTGMAAAFERARARAAPRRHSRRKAEQGLRTPPIPPPPQRPETPLVVEQPLVADGIEGIEQVVREALNPIAGEVHYRLSLETWPLREGIHFLSKSMCNTHRPDLQELLEAFRIEELRQRDLRAVAAIVLDSCGGEAKFVLRGSLMDRVRRLLLLAGGEPLPLSFIARQGRLEPGNLRRKLRRNTGKWVEALEPDLPSTLGKMPAPKSR